MRQNLNVLNPVYFITFELEMKSRYLVEPSTITRGSETGLLLLRPVYIFIIYFYCNNDTIIEPISKIVDQCSGQGAERVKSGAYTLSM